MKGIENILKKNFYFYLKAMTLILLLSESHDPEILSCTLTATYLHM